MRVRREKVAVEVAPRISHKNLRSRTSRVAIRSNRRRPSPRRCNLAVLRRYHSTTPRRFSRRFRLIWRRAAMVALANDRREQSPSVRIGLAWLSARLVRGSWVGVWPESASGNDARFISRAARVSCRDTVVLHLPPTLYSVGC